MESVVLVIHLFLALAIIALVLLQRSEGGGLGIGGGSGGGGLGGFASAKSTANVLTKLTAACAAAFFITSLALGVMAGGHTQANQGLLEAVSVQDIQAEAPVEAPVAGVTFTEPEIDVAPEKNATIEAEKMTKDEVQPPLSTQSEDQTQDPQEPLAPVAQ